MRFSRVSAFPVCVLCILCLRADNTVLFVSPEFTERVFKVYFERGLLGRNH